MQTTTTPPPSMVGGVGRAEFLLGVPLPPDIKQGGNFTCIATNEVGTAVRTVEVIVQSKCCCNVMMMSLLRRDLIADKIDNFILPSVCVPLSLSLCLSLSFRCFW